MNAAVIDSLTLCEGPDRARNEARESVRECIRAVAGLESVRPRGIVLTGSFARGEGSLMECGGKLKSLSDMEFLGVLDGPEDYFRKMAEVRRLEPLISERLKERGIDCKVEFILASRRYFSNISPSIFGYELRTHGKEVYGDTGVLESIPRFGPADIPRLDAFYLLCNRIVEQVCAYRRFRDGMVPVEDFIYSMTKSYLDLATSVLTFAGKYEPTYAGRAAALGAMDLAGILKGPDAAALVRKVDHWTSFKLRPSMDAFAGFTKEEAVGQWRELARFVYRVWHWELSALLKTHGEDPARVAREFARQGGGRNFKWLKLGLRALRGKRMSDFIGARYFAGEPRHMLYMEASRLYFLTAMPGGEFSALGGLKSMMPIRSGSIKDFDGRADEIVRIWTLYFRNN